jgi:hypothetical protein
MREEYTPNSPPPVAPQQDHIQAVQMVQAVRSVTERPDLADNAAVQGYGFEALSSLCSLDDAARSEHITTGGCNRLLAAFDKFPKHASAWAGALGAFTTLANNSPSSFWHAVGSSISAIEGRVSQALKDFPEDPRVLSRALHVLAALGTSPCERWREKDEELCRRVVEAMEAHSQTRGVLLAACDALSIVLSKRTFAAPAALPRLLVDTIQAHTRDRQVWSVAANDADQRTWCRI